MIAPSYFHVYVVILIVLWPATAPAIEWTNKDGESIEADFVGLEGNTVILKRISKTYRVSLSELSAKSSHLAKTLAAKSFMKYLLQGDIPFRHDESTHSIRFSPDGTAVLKWKWEAGIDATKYRWGLDGSSLMLQRIERYNNPEDFFSFSLSIKDGKLEATGKNISSEKFAFTIEPPPVNKADCNQSAMAEACWSAWLGGSLIFQVSLRSFR